MSNLAAQELQSFVRRIEALDDEIRALNSDKSEVFKEVKGAGFTAKTLRKVVAARRMDAAERDEADTEFELYWNAVHGIEIDDVRAHVETIEQFPVEHDADGVFPDDEVTHETTNGGLNESAAHPEPVNHPGRRQSAPAPEVEQNGSEHQRSELTETNKAPAGRVADESPASNLTTFTPKPLRPYCLNADKCGGQGRQHCWSCQKAHDEKQGVA